MSTVATQAPPRWWEGVGSPGVGGYVLSDLAAVAALAVDLPPVLSGDVEDWPAGLCLGAATAIGRAAVIPLALARRTP